MGSTGGGRVQKLLMVCLHNKAIVARGILVTMLHCGTPEPRLSATYIVSSVGTSLINNICIRELFFGNRLLVSTIRIIGLDTVIRNDSAQYNDLKTRKHS